MSPRPVSRREFLGAATVAAAGFPIFFRAGQPTFAATPVAAYIPPQSPRARLNFNLNWRFIREDVSGAEVAAFDDSKWATVSTPHSFNDVDSFRMIISHGGGDRGTYKGLSWYRKHFKLAGDLCGQQGLPRVRGDAPGRRHLLEWQAGRPLRERRDRVRNRHLPMLASFRREENVLAVKVDNRTTYKERAFVRPIQRTLTAPIAPVGSSGTRTISIPTTAASTGMSGCMSLGKIHQTLPLYYGLESHGRLRPRRQLQHREEDRRRHCGCRGAQRIGRSGDGGLVRRRSSTTRAACARSSTATRWIWWMARRAC